MTLLRHPLLSIGVVIGVAAALGASVSAQTHLAAIRGIVLDPSGAVVPDASFRLVSEATGRERDGTTGPDGSFSVTQLEPGAYRLEVEAAGHKRSVSRATLAVEQRLRLDVSLEIGAVEEEVVVAAPELLDPLSMGLGTLLGNQLVQSLPLDGRNFLELALLAPGTTSGAPGSAESVRGEFAFSANGSASSSFLLDGSYNNSATLNTMGTRPPVDAIAEFKVQTGGHDASFGRNAGAQINIITKSGGNTVTGTAYGFFRSAGMGARNRFAPPHEPAPDYERSQTGFSLGGPVARDRTFFFVDYEATRLLEGITQVTNVPTLAERQGDFSASALRPLNPFTGQPFPGDRIPPFFLHPVGVSLAALYPLPNRDIPNQNFVSSPARDEDIDRFDVKLDHGFTSSSKLTTRYSFNDERLFEPFSTGTGLADVPGFGFDRPRRAQNLLVSQTDMLSSSVINDLRVVFNRVSSRVDQENIGTSINRRVGLPELSDAPRTWGLSAINVTGFSPLGDESNNPQDSALTTLQLMDTLTWARGPHLLKTGFDFRFTRQEAFRDVQSRGFLTFSDFGFTGNALADMLLGLPVVTGGARLDNPQRLRTQSYNVFIHDDYRVTPALTVSAGLRYELNTPPVDADDRANVYDVDTGTLVPVGTGGIPRGGYATDTNNLAPRVGVAWAPGRASRTVLRGGYGVYYDQSSLAPNEGLYFNPPFFDLGLFFPLPEANLFLSLDDPFPASFPIPVPPLVTTFQRDLETPYLHHWNAGAQHELGRGRTVEVSYVGSRGRNLIRSRDINQATPSPVVPNLRPNPRFGGITSIESTGRSEYDALQVRFSERMPSGAVLATYTLADCRDDASGFFSSTGDPNFPQDSNHPDAEWGPCSFQPTHRFTLGLTYDLPFGPGHELASGGWPAAVLGDWQVASVVTLESGVPFTVAVVPELDISNTGQTGLGFGFNDRPNVVGDPGLDDPSADAWFSPSAYALPPFGSFGDAGRNALEGPGFANVNLALVKRVGLGGQARLQLRVEAFNVLNRTNLGLPDAFLGSPTFGQILMARDPRRLQLGVRLLF